MNHSIEELQFAATVRALAAAMRNGARPYPAVPGWDEANTLDDFVLRALSELGRVADLIKQPRE